MAHPYVALLRDRRISVLWLGMALSLIGSELFRVGAIWLAAELAGPRAALLASAQAAAILTVSLFAGPVVERLPRGRFLVASELITGLASAAVVVVALTVGLSFPMLVTASVITAAFGAMGRPVLLSGLPQLAPGQARAINGLFDSTMRIAQAVGPVLAAAAMKVLPAIHLLTANAFSFLASAGALAIMGRQLDRPKPAPPQKGVLRRLGRGVIAASNCPGVWGVVIVTGLRGGFYALGYMVAVPLLFTERGGSLGDVAIIFAATAATELLSTPLLVLTSPRRPLRRLYHGYGLIGGGLALMGIAASLPESGRTPAMATCGLLIGLGNSTAGLQMMTFFASRLDDDDFAAVLRLRQVMVVSAMMLTTLAGPLILPALGTAATIVASGLVALAMGVAGSLSRQARTLGPGFVPPPH